MKKTLTLIATLFALNLNAQLTGGLDIEWDEHPDAGTNLAFKIFGSTNYLTDINEWEELAFFDSYNTNLNMVVTNYPLKSIPKVSWAFYMRSAYKDSIDTETEAYWNDSEPSVIIYVDAPPTNDFAYTTTGIVSNKLSVIWQEHPDSGPDSTFQFFGTTNISSPTKDWDMFDEIASVNNGENVTNRLLTVPIRKSYYTVMRIRKNGPDTSDTNFFWRASGFSRVVSSHALPQRIDQLKAAAQN